MTSSGDFSWVRNYLDNSGVNLVGDRPTKLNRGKGHAPAGTTRQSWTGCLIWGPMYGSGLISPINCISELVEVLGGMGRLRGKKIPMHPNPEIWRYFT